MSFHSTRQVNNQARLNENKPNKDFEACYNDFFNPMMKVISSAVDVSIGNKDLFNSGHYKNYKETSIQFNNIISYSKKDILDLFEQVGHAKIGLRYCNDVINGSNKKKNSSDLLNKCNVDEGIMSLNDLRKELCKDAVELLTRVTEEYDNEIGMSNNILELANYLANWHENNYDESQLSLPVPGDTN